MRAPWSRKVYEAVTQPDAVAGAVTVPSGSPVETGEGRTQGWQVRAWQLWPHVGELHYPTAHLARQVGRLHWSVSVDGTLLGDDASNILLALATRGLGLREASRLLALNYQVAGEARYIEGDDGAFDVWAVTSQGLDQKVDEARKSRKFQFRFFNPDPVDPTLADSSVRTALGPAEELLTYESLARAQSRSRIAQAGALLVPQEAAFEEGADPFGKDMEEAMMAPIADVDHPSALVPIKIEMPADLIDVPRHLILERPYDDEIHLKQERAIRRIALALDIPPELLLGVDTVTHWTAWLVALETYTSHLEPLAAPIGELYAEVIEGFYLREGREAVVKVEPDPGELLAKRSTVRDAMDAAKLGAVGLEYVREAIGADPEDAPTDDDLEILRLLPRETGREPMVDEQTGAPEPSGVSPIAASVAGEIEPLPVTEPIEPGFKPDGIENGVFKSGELAGVLAMTSEQVRTRVGSKLRTSLRGTDMAGSIEGIPNRDVIAVLGLESLNGFDLSRAVVESLTPFEEWWSRSGRDHISPAMAALLVGSWIAEKLAYSTAEMGPTPERLMADLTDGIKEMAHV